MEIKLRNIIIVIVLLCSIETIAAEKVKANQASIEETLKTLSVFGDVFEKIKKDYVEAPKDKELIEYAINGMLTSLDPHSSYLNQEEYDAMRTQLKGEFGGLGIEIIMDMGLVKIISPLDDSPAFIAGIKAGDYIFAIDNIPVMGLSSTEAVKKMRGKPGTKVHLSIIREGQKEPLEIDVIRQVIKNNPVKSKLDGEIGYVRINSFTDNTTKTVVSELEQIKKIQGKNLKGVVLDLRNNPGGLLDQAVSVSDLFLEQGEIVSIKARLANNTMRYMAKPGDIIKNITIVVLINEGSASAAEIVAGALQDNKRAVIMGVKSFGKASVQSVIPIGTGYGAMKMTTARYYTPTGRSLQAEGIVPDIIVLPSKVELLTPKDSNRIFAEVNLKGHLSSENKTKPATPEVSKGDKIVEPSNSELTNPANKNVILKPEEKILFDQDYQLTRGIDLLKALSLLGKK